VFALNKFPAKKQAKKTKPAITSVKDKGEEMIWLYLLALNVAVFAVEMFAAGTVMSLFAFVPAKAASQPWTLITSMFVHAGLTHLFLNMWALFVFGPILERMLGAQKFLALFLIAGIIGNVGFALFYPSNIAGVGASGAIYGILGALAVLAPNLVVLVFFLPMPMWMAAIAWAIFEYVSALSPSPIANLVHLTGLAAGIAVGLYYKKQYADELNYYVQ